jgi:dihydrofolate reductase
MKKLIVEAEVSLDGVVNSNEMWGSIFKYHSEDVKAYLTELLFSPEALIMGRLTYEAFAEAWSSRAGSDAERINAMPKYVASRTLKRPLHWNATLLEGDIVEQISKLKEQPGKDLLQYGIGELTSTLHRHKLLDEIQILVFPFIFGKGERWFDKLSQTHFKLIETRPFLSGAVLLRYAVIL